jgi:hypothetical protein
LPRDGRGQKVQSLTVHESQLIELCFLTAVTVLATEQRMNNKFCFKLGKTPIEAYEVLQTVCGDETLNRSCIFEWFNDECEDLQDDPRSRRASTSRNADIIGNVREILTRRR